MGNSFGFSGFFGMFNLFSVLFTLVFALVFGTILYTLIRNIKQERKNDQSPRLSIDAKVVAKRTNHTRHRGGQHHMAHTTTTYYATFEVASGDRMELRLQGHEYGLIVEGDYGELTFQGTRFLGFSRKLVKQ